MSKKLKLYEYQDEPGTVLTALRSSASPAPDIGVEGLWGWGTPHM